MKWIGTIILLLNFLSFAQNPSPASDLILSEVLYDLSGADDSLEWVELYNRGNSAIDLSNYSLGNGGADYTTSLVQLSGTIQSKSFFVVGGPNSDNSNANPTYDQVINFNPDFQNGGTASDGVALFNVQASSVTSSTVPIDVVIYDSPNSNNLINTTGNPGSSDVGDAPAGSSVERTSVNPNTWQIQSSPTPGTSAFETSLPVSLISFTATAGNNKVTLRWATASEQENVGFKIMRSNEQSGNYQQLASYENNPELEGQFNSNTQTNYKFADETVTNDVTYWYKLVDVDVNGVHTEHGPMSATPHSVGNEVTTIIAVPAGTFNLHPNYPNPFNPSTTLRFDIPGLSSGQQAVEMIIFNSQGQKIKTLFKGALTPGTHELSWNGVSETSEPVSSGMYYAVLKMENLVRTTKLLLIK